MCTFAADRKTSSLRGHGAPIGSNGQNLRIQSFNSFNRTPTPQAGLVGKTDGWPREPCCGLEVWLGNSECESFKLETKFKDLSYEIGLRKSVQQQLQRKMGELHQQAKENIARPIFDVAKPASKISSLGSGYRTLRYELTSKDSTQQHQGRAFLGILREKQRQVDYLERGNKFRVALERPANFLQVDRSAILLQMIDLSACLRQSALALGDSTCVTKPSLTEHQCLKSLVRRSLVLGVGGRDVLESRGANFLVNAHVMSFYKR